MLRRTSMLFVVCVLLMLGLMPIARAQDAAPEVTGFFALSGTEGTLEESDDGVYDLTLEGVQPTTVWMITAPEYFSGWYDTALLTSQWLANTETPLTTTALLTTETVTLRMTVGQPAYDPMTETLTLQVTNVEAFPVEESKKKKGSDVPDEFEGAYLNIVIDTAFNDGILAGDTILTSEGRNELDNPPKKPGGSNPGGF